MYKKNNKLTKKLVHMKHGFVEILQQNLHLRHHSMCPAQCHPERFLSSENIRRLDKHIQSLLILIGIRKEIAQSQSSRIVGQPLLFMEGSAFALDKLYLFIIRKIMYFRLDFILSKGGTYFLAQS